MALVYMEGFEVATASRIRQGRFVAIGDDGEGLGRYGGYCGRTYLGASIVRMFPVTYTELTLGFAVKGTNPVACQPNSTLAAFVNAAQTDLIRITLSVDNHLEIRNASSSVLATSTMVFPSNVWRYVEVHYKQHATAGVIEVRVDESVWVTYIGNTSSATDIGGFYFWGIASGYNDTLYDDLYLTDANTPNAGYLGDVKITTLLPSAPGDSADMTPVGDTPNWKCVDAFAVGTPSTYVQSDTVDQKDIYNFANISTTGGIKGIQVGALWKKDDTGTVQGKIITKPTTVETLSAPLTVNSQYTWALQQFDVNPDTSAAWTESELNATQFGIKRVL